MHTETEELLLTENYEFDIAVQLESAEFAGGLRLTPERITLKIMGELSKDRHHGFDGWRQDIETLICSRSPGANDFLLLGLRFVESKERIIRHHSEWIAYFERKYEVERVI